MLFSAPDDSMGCEMRASTNHGAAAAAQRGRMREGVLCGDASYFFLTIRPLGRLGLSSATRLGSHL